MYGWIRGMVYLFLGVFLNQGSSKALYLLNFHDIQVWIQMKTGNGSSYGFSYIFLFQRHRTHFSLYFHSINIKTSILWFSNTTNKKDIVSQVRWIKWIFLLKNGVFPRNIVRSLALAYRPTFLLYRNPMTSNNYYIYSTNFVLCFGTTDKKESVPTRYF